MADIIVVVTKEGKYRDTKMITAGDYFIVDKFVMGNGGHDPLTNNAIAPDRSLTSLPRQTFGPKTIDAAYRTITDNLTAQFRLVVETTEAAGTDFSNIGLIGTIQAGSNAGVQFLYAIGTLDRRTKLSNERITFTAIVRH